MIDDPRVAFIKAATWHGPLAPAESILAATPALATADIHVAAILGDVTTVQQLLASDPRAATRASAPYGGDALTYLCLSKYLRFDRSRTGDFLEAARALLNAGASARAGFWTPEPNAEFETALYGAAGVAHNGPLTQLLLDHGADPNDGEAVYHSPETENSEALKVLVESGRLTKESLALMLLRKLDWHEIEGARYLLEHGTDPDQGWGRSPRLPLHHSIARDNGLEFIALLLRHGADPALMNDGVTAITRAARRGRGDVLEFLAEKGFPLPSEGVDPLIAACAMDNVALVRELTHKNPSVVGEVVAMGGQLLAEFAGTWNTPGVRHLLDLGVPIDARYRGDDYFDVAAESTALHVAAWKGVPSTVKLLLERGATADARDGKGRTPLMLAVKATVDSYWTYRRTPSTVEMLLSAGASVDGAMYPCGYDEVDALLRAHGAHQVCPA